MTKKMIPIRLLRIFGLIDGISLLILVLIAMPLKYFFAIPEAVSIIGRIHGAIFIGYFLAIILAQLMIRWRIYWSLICLLVALIPFGNFILDAKLKKREEEMLAKPFPTIWLVYSIIFFSFIDLFSQLPIMSTYAQSLGASLTLIGIIVGMYSFANTGGNILAGMLTDRWGSFRVLVLGLIGTTISLVSYYFVESPYTLVVVRFLHGFIGGFIVPAAFTFVANEKSEKKGSQTALTGAFIGIAAIIGPACSGVIAARSTPTNVFLLVAVIGALLFIAAILKLRQQKTWSEKSEAVLFVWNRHLFYSFLGAFLLMFSQGALSYLLPLRVNILGHNSSLSGMLLSVFGLVAVLFFLLPTKKIFDSISPLKSFQIGIFLLAISQMLLGIVDIVSVYFVVLACYGTGFAFIFPAINLLLIQGTTSQNRGKAYGVFYAFFSLGVVMGSSGLGILPLSISQMFLATGFILLTGCLLGSVRLPEKQEVISKKRTGS
jgi:integral membrane protein